MNDIIKHIFDAKPNYKKKQSFLKKSSIQGSNLIHEKNKKINQLKSHFKKMLQSNKIIEGNTQREFIDLDGKRIEITSFSEIQKTNIRDIISNFNRDKELYNSKLTEYESKYKTLMQNFIMLQENVDDCKVNCNESSKFDNQQEKYACKLGCFLNGPYLKECEDTFQDTETTSCGITAQEQCENYKAKDAYSPNTLIDENNLSLVDGCCHCGGGQFGAPKKNISGTVYDNCDTYDDENLRNACNEGISISNALKENILSSENLNRTIVDRYSEVVTLNQEMITLSDNLLGYINSLKDFSIYVNENKLEVQSKFMSDKSELDEYKRQIEMLEGNKKNRIDKFLSDSRLKSEAYKMRMYVWLILAVGFGSAALYQIKKF